METYAHLLIPHTWCFILFVGCVLPKLQVDTLESNLLIGKRQRLIALGSNPVHVSLSSLSYLSIWFAKNTKIPRINSRIQLWPLEATSLEWYISILVFSRIIFCFGSYN